MRKIWLLISLFAVLCVATSNAAYVDEYPESYTWAYKNWITTMDTIDKANMYGEITRIELSKMISNYAINVLKKKPDTSKKCEFSDVSDKLNTQYDLWVTKACQLWLMWQWISKFRPGDNVTRAEFWTILSRLLYWTKYDGWKPYYIKHINNLNIRWIMNNTNNAEKLDESRGNVMVMLKRSEEKWNNNIPSFEELDDVVYDKCPSDYDWDDYDNIYRRSFIIPYKSWYIWYDYWWNSWLIWYYLTYKYLDNPCNNISQTSEIFIWNVSYKYYKEMYNSYDYPDNKLYISDWWWSPINDVVIKNLNCKEWDKVCEKEVNKFMYNLIIWEENNEYFTQWINKFKKDIDNNKFTGFEFWNNIRRNCNDKTNNNKCIIEYLKS